MKIKNLTFIILTLFSAEFFSQSKTDKIDSLLANAYKINEFNGVALVAEGGHVLLHKGYGFYDIEKKKKVNVTIPFYIGSVAKQFTSMLIMILKAQKKLSFDDSLKKFFPDIPDIFKAITIRQLMTHTSGIPDYYDKIELKHGLKNADIFNFITKIDSLDFEPGTKYSYSNTGYVLLALVIEKISRIPYREFLIYNILARPQMLGTDVADIDRHKPDIRAFGYKKDGTRDDYNFNTYGAGGIYSTTEDLFIYDQVLYNKNFFIPDSVLNEAFTPTKLKDGTIVNYGFGWQIAESDSEKIVFHTGSLNGFRSYFERNLTKKNTIILLTNKTCERLKEIREEIVNILEGKDYKYLEPVTEQK